MDEYYYLEEYFKEKTGFFHEDWIYSMTYDKKIDYLEYWMKENKSLSNNEFVDKICRQLEILDMAKYIGNNNYNEPKLILYIGLVPSNQKEVFTILTNYEGKSKDYILATETELNKFISVDFYDISLRIGYYCPLEVQERINDFVFSKAVERHAEGNVPAIIMNVGNGFGEVWLKDELPALIESDAVTMVDGIDMHLLRNMDKSSISKCIEAVSHVAYDNINKANVNSLLNNVSKLKETSYYGLSERVIDHNHNGELDYNEAVALYSTKRDCELLINWGYGFVKRFSNDIYMEYLEKVPNTSNAASYHSTNNLHMYIDQNSKYVTFTDPGKNSPPHEQWNYQSNSEIFQEDPWPCPHPDQPDDDEVHNENHDEHENSSNKNKSLGKKAAEAAALGLGAFLTIKSLVDLHKTLHLDDDDDDDDDNHDDPGDGGTAVVIISAAALTAIAAAAAKASSVSKFAQFFQNH